MSGVEFKCSVCKKEFKHFSSYKSHVIKSHSRMNDYRDEDENSELDAKQGKSSKSNTDASVCQYCALSFSTKYTLNRHIKKYCKAKSDISSKTGSLPLLQATPEIIASIAAIIKATSVLNGTQNGNYNTNSNSNTTNQHNGDVQNIGRDNITNTNNLLINQEIKINPLGKENLDHITEADKLEFLHMGAGAVPALARAILEQPENRNIAICDKKAGKVMFINRKGKVEIANMDRVIGWFTDDNIGRINDYITEYDDQFSPNDRILQRLKILQGHETIDTDEEEEHDDKYEAYYVSCSSQVKDAVELNSRLALKNIKKYRDFKAKQLATHLATSLLTE